MDSMSMTEWIVLGLMMIFMAVMSIVENREGRK